MSDGERPTNGGDPTQPAPAVVSAPPAPITRIANRYDLLALVGTGGMGSVYRALDTELGEVVALKVLRRELLQSSEMLERFRREVSLARKVTHRNVARTFDIGDHEGDRFLTMEFIEGESLGDQLARRGSFDVSTFLDVACEICLGLEAAHNVGVIHLDLKPDNVLITVDGRIVISDFGIARAVGSADLLGGRTVVAGTPTYMAPEQVVGDELDEASDTYALGAILFEMLVGAPAWEGSSSFAVASARLLRPPPDPRERRADVPDEVAAVVLGCMARDKGKRFASVAAVRAALEAARRARPSGSHRAQPARPLEPIARAVAVLPFRNGGDASDQYFADGLTEELIDALADSPRVRVRARGAIMPFKGSDRDPRDIGRLLGVEVVVEGSIRRASGMLHVNARVTGVEDGYHLWARRFDVPERQLLRVAAEIAAAAARALEAPADPRQRDTGDEIAFDLFLRGRYELNKGSAELARSAIAHFERALTRLPNDPSILAAYAQAQFRRFAFDAEDPNAEEAWEIAERAARRALELSPTLGEARVSLANLKLSVGDGVGAALELGEALRTTGGTSALGRDLQGRLLAEVGTPEAALVHLRAAIAIDPSLERLRADVLRLEAMLGRWRDLGEVVGEGADPQSVFWFLCARLSLWHPDVAWATDLRARVEPLAFPQRALTMQLLRARLGETDPDEVAPMLLALTQRRGTRRSVRGPMFMRQVLAELRLYAGHHDDAMDEIERASQLGLMDIVWLERCPLMRGLAGNPRFVSVRREVTDRAAQVRAALARIGATKGQPG